MDLQWRRMFAKNINAKCLLGVRRLLNFKYEKQIEGEIG